MDDLDKLKDLLFGAEKEVLHSIAERVEQPEIRTDDVAAVLPDAIRQSHTKDRELLESLTDPVGECLQQAFRDDPETYGDALYPVMGPAIRKSIAHTLRSFSEQLNRVAEQSFTPKGLKWRFQASRAGIPFSDFVVQKSLLYRVEQAYLISRENGLLVDHVHHLSSKIKDSDAVSAMFTAIQDFVKESFSPDRTGRLETADMGEFTLWAVHGPHALLVCVIRGVPPGSLRGELSAILERIHFRYGEAIRNYSGDTSTMPDVDRDLRKCLEFQAAQDGKDTKRSIGWPTWLLALALIVLIGYFSVSNWLAARQLAELTAALKGTPGLFVASTHKDGDQFVVDGMRDPLATPVADVASRFSIADDQIIENMTPFQSLEPEIVQKRVENALAGMESVQFTLSGANLFLNGEAPWGWLSASRPQLLAIAGVNTVDASAVVNPELGQLAAEINALSGARFLFSGGATFASTQEDLLRTFAETLSQLQARAARANYTVKVSLTGSTDAIGEALANVDVGRRRIAAASAVLSEFDISTDEEALTGVSDSATGSGPALELRNVAIDLAFVPLNDSP
jgi:OOP family OmpA-OmpF porin